MLLVRHVVLCSGTMKTPDSQECLVYHALLLLSFHSFCLYRSLSIFPTPSYLSLSLFFLHLFLYFPSAFSLFSLSLLSLALSHSLLILSLLLSLFSVSLYFIITLFCICMDMSLSCICTLSSRHGNRLVWLMREGCLLSGGVVAVSSERVSVSVCCVDSQVGVVALTF